MRCVSSCGILLKPHNLQNVRSLAVTVARSSFSMKHGKVMPPLYKPHQTSFLLAALTSVRLQVVFLSPKYLNLAY